MNHGIQFARRGRIILTLAVLSLGTLPAFSVDLQAEAEVLFEKGRTLIQQNQPESMSGTKEGLERGIELARRAKDLGFFDVQAALLQLAEGMDFLAHGHFGGNEEVFNDLTSHRDQIYRRLLELNPDSAEILCENAVLNEDEETREELLRRAVEIDPNHAESSYILGMQLIEEGNFEEGLPLARRGVENSEPLIIQSYGLQLLTALQSAGLESEARAFDKRYKELLQEKLWIPTKPDEE